MSLSDSTTAVDTETMSGQYCFSSYYELSLDGVAYRGSPRTRSREAELAALRVAKTGQSSSQLDEGELCVLLKG